MILYYLITNNGGNSYQFSRLVRHKKAQYISRDLRVGHAQHVNITRAQYSRIAIFYNVFL